MAKALGNTERPVELVQNADAEGQTTRSQQRSASFTRYWHKPSTPGAIPTSEAKTTQSNRSFNSDSVFQFPISSDAVTTIELLKNEPAEVVELQSSDEDEVVEVALPPKPTITIESSDEGEHDPVLIEPIASTPQNKRPQQTASEKKNKKRQKNKRRAASASPVPSVVSSISDDFIRGDCVAFNITRRPTVERFDFRLHGMELTEQQSNKQDRALTPVSLKKKKRNKKSKDKSTPTPCPEPPSPQSPSPDLTEHTFSTPRSSKHAGSNYTVCETSMPCADVYESDSNQSALIESVTQTVSVQINVSSEANGTSEKAPPIPPTEHASEKLITEPAITSETQPINVTSRESVTVKEPVPIEDNLVMGNVSGLEPAEPLSSPRANSRNNALSWRPVSRGPARITSDDQAIVHNSKNNCREEMDRFYNDSWGGEDFNHFEIQRNMSMDKTLWTIDPRDKQLSVNTRRRCHYCNHIGHSYDRCRYKPRVCHMCGTEGHYEPRCPQRMCLRCGTANGIYSVHCRNCAQWSRTFCGVCQTYGHPVEHCPDLWRRYHNTVENDGILTLQTWRKRRGELFCSGCTRRGHLVHTCHQLTFSNLPVSSPFVFQYRPVFPPTSFPQYPTVSPAGRYFTMPEDGSQAVLSQQQTPYEQASRVQSLSNAGAHDALKRKTPPPNDQTSYKRRISNTETSNQADPKDDVNMKRKPSASNERVLNERSISTSEVTNINDNVPCAVSSTTGVLQDSEVSNTSDIVNTAKIYVEKSVIEELKKQEGANWVRDVSAQNRVEVTVEENPTANLVVTGLPSDQECFNEELRMFVKKLGRKETQDTPADVTDDGQMNDKDDFSSDIPHKKYNALRMLNRALQSLQSDLGDPKSVYREFLYLQNNHKKLLKQKVISPKKLQNSRRKLNVTLSTLNTILLGQAGLGEGSRRVRELYALQAVLSKYRRSTLSQDLRRRVGDNYHFVFGTVARDDYADLMGKYYNKRLQPSDLNVPLKLNKPANQSQSDDPKVSAATLKRRQRKLKRKLKKSNVEQCHENTSEDQIKTKTVERQVGEAVNKKQKQTLSKIYSYQKKLRKECGGDEQKRKLSKMLLHRLQVYQVHVKTGQMKHRHARLKKLFAELNRFFGES